MTEIRKPLLDAAALLSAVTAFTVAPLANAQPIEPKKPIAINPSNVGVMREPIALQLKGSETTLRAQATKLSTTDPVKGQILTTLLDKAKVNPGFNPAALSISFKLKW